MGILRRLFGKHEETVREKSVGTLEGVLLEGPVSVSGWLKEARDSTRAANGYVEAIRRTWEQLTEQAKGPQASLDLVKAGAKELVELHTALGTIEATLTPYLNREYWQEPTEVGARIESAFSDVGRLDRTAKALLDSQYVFSRDKELKMYVSIQLNGLVVALAEAEKLLGSIRDDHSA